MSAHAVGKDPPNYAVVWRTDDGPTLGGRLELSGDGLILHGSIAEDELRIAFGELSAVEIGREAHEQVTALILERHSCERVLVAALGGVGLLGELNELLARRRSEHWARAQVAIVIPVRPGTGHYGKLYGRGEGFAKANRLVVGENRWLAARHGLRAWLVTGADEAVGARTLIACRLNRVADGAAALGCEWALERVESIAAEGTSADRQLRLVRHGHSLADVLRGLVERKVPALAAPLRRRRQRIRRQLCQPKRCSASRGGPGDHPRPGRRRLPHMGVAHELLHRLVYLFPLEQEDRLALGEQHFVPLDA